MRITSPTPVQPAKGVKQRKAPTSSSQFAGNIEEQQAATPAQSTQSAMPISGIDSMLLIQGVDPDESNRQAAVQQAGGVLDALEQVRRGILLGAIPVGRLQRLSNQLQQQLETASDPNLVDILTDIVLRARVELAKAGIYK